MLMTNQTRFWSCLVHSVTRSAMQFFRCALVAHSRIQFHFVQQIAASCKGIAECNTSPATFSCHCYYQLSTINNACAYASLPSRWPQMRRILSRRKKKRNWMRKMKDFVIIEAMKNYPCLWNSTLVADASKVIMNRFCLSINKRQSTDSPQASSKNL